MLRFDEAQHDAHRTATSGSPRSGGRRAARPRAIYRSRVGSGGAQLDPVLRRLLRRDLRRRCCATWATWTAGGDATALRRSATCTWGRPESGVRRYGRIVAEAAARRSDVAVVESDAGGRDAGLADLRLAARRLRDADVVHLQWKLADWGGPRWALPRLEVVLQACRRPAVVTLHDVYERHHLRGALAGAGRARHAPARHPVPDARGARRGGAAAAGLAGATDAGSRSCRTSWRSGRPCPTATPRRPRSGLAGRRVITLQGFMTRRKGHRLVLEALRLLPADVVAIFAGSPIEGREARGQELGGVRRGAGRRGPGALHGLRARR